MLLEKPAGVQHENGSGTGAYSILGLCLAPGACGGSEGGRSEGSVGQFGGEEGPWGGADRLVSRWTACAIYGIDAHPTQRIVATAGGGERALVWPCDGRGGSDWLVG
jgi:hypothetical protein